MRAVANTASRNVLGDVIAGTIAYGEKKLGEVTGDVADRLREIGARHEARGNETLAKEVQKLQEDNPEAREFLRQEAFKSLLSAPVLWLGIAGVAAWYLFK